MPVSYQSSKNGCDVYREDNASTIIKACNNTSALSYTLHIVVVVLTLTRIIKSVVTGQAPVTLHICKSCCTPSTVSVGEGNSNDGMHVLEYSSSSSSCGLQITLLCRRFQTAPFRGRIPAANARLLT